MCNKSAKGCVKSHSIDHINSACEISHCAWILNHSFGPHLYVGRWQVKDEILGQVVRWSGGWGSGAVGGWSEVVALVGGWQVANQRFLRRPPTAKRPHSPSLATHLLTKLSWEECQLKSSPLKRTLGVSWSLKIWEDIWEVSKVHLNFPLYLQSCQTLQHQWSIRRRKEAANIVCGPFSPSLYAGHYLQLFHGCTAWYYHDFFQTPELFGQKQALHLLANAKMQHGSTWSKIGFNLASASTQIYFIIPLMVSKFDSLIMSFPKQYFFHIQKELPKVICGFFLDNFKSNLVIR